MCKFSPVEGVLDFDLRVNNIQSLGCIEVEKAKVKANTIGIFCELKRLNLAYNQITDERKTLPALHSHILTAKETKLRSWS